MIQLIITANDTLYERLTAQSADDQELLRATNVLSGFKLATMNAVDRIVVDMALHAADTLIETLHARPETAHLQVYVIKSGKQIPFELWRLCTDVLEVQTL